MSVSRWRKLVCLSILLAGAATSSAAWADRFYHGPRFRVYVGPSVGWVWYNAPPAYYYPYPSVVAVPAAPPAYIEQGQPPAQTQPPASAQAPSNYWYYCSKPEGYYPYIKQCPGGWQRVEPQPPSQS